MNHALHPAMRASRASRSARDAMWRTRVASPNGLLSAAVTVTVHLLAAVVGLRVGHAHPTQL